MPDNKTEAELLVDLGGRQPAQIDMENLIYSIYRKFDAVPTDQEIADSIAAAVTALKGGASAGADTLGELEALDALKLAKAQNLLDLPDPAQARENILVPTYVATRTALKALDTTKDFIAFLTESGRAGLFVWRTGNFSAQAAIDTLEGVYLKADAIANTVGMWVRVYDHALNVKWFGAVGAGTAVDDSPAFQCALDLSHGITAGHLDVLVPAGVYRINTGLTLATQSRLIGIGQQPRLDAGSANVAILTVTGSLCAVENLTLYNPYLPTADFGTLTYTAGSDSSFRRLRILGGWKGVSCTGGGDSVWDDINISDCYSDFFYTISHSGVWGNRLKLDESWPVQTPTASNLKGNWATSTAYSVGDIVFANNRVFQCSVAGTSAAAGGGPTTTVKGTPIVDGAGTLRWLCHCVTGRAALHIDGGCFIHKYTNSDFTGGHPYGVILDNVGGGSVPQSVYFDDACEFGSPIFSGIKVTVGQNINISDTIIDGAISSTVGFGVELVNADNVNITGCTIQGNGTYGITVGASCVSVSINHNAIQGNVTNGIQVAAATTQFRIQDNEFTGVWGVNGTKDVVVAAGASDVYWITGNHWGTGKGLTDGGAGANKFISENQ